MSDFNMNIMRFFIFLVTLMSSYIFAYDYDENQLILPISLEKGDTIGLFTPSWPAHVILKNKYNHALNEIERAGFSYIEGNVTSRKQTQGYRTASPQERANEFMDLIRNPEIKCLMAVIGGYNTSSILPYLDYEEIRKSRKIICGYSDITALHLAILKKSGLVSFYGPCVVSSFGEYPHILSESLDSFLKMTQHTSDDVLDICPPSQWSNQFIDANQECWKAVERGFIRNEGWKVLSPGSCRGQLIVANLDVMLSLANTPYFPSTKGKVLLIEETFAYFSQSEKRFRQLELMGALDDIVGLIISKPGGEDPEGASFSYIELIEEIIGSKPYVIIYNFDCGHTFPLLTFPEGLKINVRAENEDDIHVSVMGPVCESENIEENFR